MFEYTEARLISGFIFFSDYKYGFVIHKKLIILYSFIMQEKVLLYGFDTSYRNSLEDAGYDVLSDEIRRGYDITIASSSSAIPFLTDNVLIIADKAADDDNNSYILLKDNFDVINCEAGILYDMENSFSSLLDYFDVKVSFLDKTEFRPLLLSVRGSVLAFSFKSGGRVIYVFPSIAAEKLPELLKVLKQRRVKLTKPFVLPANNFIPQLKIDEYEAKRGEILHNSEKKLLELEDKFENRNQRELFLHKLISLNAGDMHTAVRLFFSYLGLELEEENSDFFIFRSEEGLIACFPLISIDIPETIQSFKKAISRLKKRLDETFHVVIVSNHQKYLPLEKREALPSSIIEEAENMQWGIIAVKDIYMLDDNINKGVLTKAWGRNQLYTQGAIDFSLKEDKLISIIKLVKRDDKHFCLISLENKLVRKNMKVVLVHEDGSMDASRILSLKVNKVSMVEAMDGDVVIELDKEAVKGSTLFTV